MQTRDPSQPAVNVHADKVHDMPSGRRILGVSHSWARAVEEELARSLDAFPDLRFVPVRVPKGEGDVRRLFHSPDGTSWSQVHGFIRGRFDAGYIARGAREVDGDPAFPAVLDAGSIAIRKALGEFLEPRDRWGETHVRATSMADWVEGQLRPFLDHAGRLYVDGAESEESRAGRRVSLETIERLIAHLRVTLQQAEPFAVRGGHFPLIGDLQRFFIRRHVPFLAPHHEGDLLCVFDRLTLGRRKELAQGLWADAARMPRGERWNHIHGALLAQAKGHPVFGEKDYERLEALLAADLAAGYRVVRLNGRLFIRSGDRWRAARTSVPSGSEAVWNDGLIVSRNHGRVIVPPHKRHAEVANGYTRNAPGEGPAEPRDEPLMMRCADRPHHGTNLAWVHAFHDFEDAAAG